MLLRHLLAAFRVRRPWGVFDTRATMWLPQSFSSYQRAAKHAAAESRRHPLQDGRFVAAIRVSDEDGARTSKETRP